MTLTSGPSSLGSGHRRDVLAAIHFLTGLQFLLMNEHPFNLKVQKTGCGPLHPLEGVEHRDDGTSTSHGGQ